MIGPWRIKLNRQEIKIKALTVIDPVTNLLEITPAPHPTTAAAAFHALETTWLSRYPRPLRCLHDNGPEFTGHDFQFALLRAGIEPKDISSANPQSNGIIESVHRSIGVILRTFLQHKQPQNPQEANLLVEQALATAMHATRCAAHSSLQRYTPGSLVFRRDMYLDIPLIADILTLQQLRQQGIDKRLLQANAKRRPHEFKVNDNVLKRREITSADKLRSTYTGPHQILQVHTNGTVTIQLTNHIRERINIRRIQPYRS
jgi:transposase InsO family protein